MTCSSFLPSSSSSSSSFFFLKHLSTKLNNHSGLLCCGVVFSKRKIITHQSSAHFLSRTRARCLCAREREIIERLGSSDRLRKRERERDKTHIFSSSSSSSSLGIGGTIGSTGGRRHRNILL